MPDTCNRTAPFTFPSTAKPATPRRDTLLRHETLAIPAQRDLENLAPSLSGRLAREFLIGHSIRSPDLRATKRGDFGDGHWSAWKFHAPLNAPPQPLVEDDLFDD